MAARPPGPPVGEPEPLLPPSRSRPEPSRARWLPEGRPEPSRARWLPEERPEPFWARWTDEERVTQIYAARLRIQTDKRLGKSIPDVVKRVAQLPLGVKHPSPELDA